VLANNFPNILYGWKILGQYFLYHRFLVHASRSLKQRVYGSIEDSHGMMGSAIIIMISYLY